METLTNNKGGIFMSRHDYTQHSKKIQNEVNEVDEELESEIIEPSEEAEIETDNENQQPVESKTYDLGVVSGCTKLRVRSEPKFGTNVVCEIEKGTRVMIDPDNSTSDYYKIYTESGVEGFCVKTYIV
jgi:hypothetical protein